MRALFSCFVLFIITANCFSQRQDSLLDAIPDFPKQYFSKVESKLASVNEKLTKKSLKYLKKLKKQEDRIQKYLAKLNLQSAENLTSTISNKYVQLSQQLISKSAVMNKMPSGDYSAYLDTLNTSLSFLKQFGSLKDKVKDPLENLKELQNSFKQSEAIKKLIADRKQQLKEQLSKFATIPKGLKKEYDKLSKTAYYYSAQVKEYKALLKDPAKLEKRAVALLTKVPAFQKFIKENSQLASLFGTGTNSSNSGLQALAGLQTRASVQSLIQEQISRGGPNAKVQIQQNLAMAHAEINKLKDRINKVGGEGGDINMPDFKPNSQKTKEFLKRLEFGSNIQFGKANYYVPSGADIGLSIGYKLNDKSVIGFGGSYKMGIGDIRKIAISHQGLGVRTFLDYKLKKNFFITGGFEMNYNAQFKNIEVLKTVNSWQRSGLIGLSKKYRISKKVKGNMQILYDFLSREHQPITQPFIYRIGYVFK